MLAASSCESCTRLVLRRLQNASCAVSIVVDLAGLLAVIVRAC